MLMKEKIIVKRCNEGSRISIDRYIALFENNKFLTKFKDYEMLTDERYINVKENAIRCYLFHNKLIAPLYTHTVQYFMIHNLIS